MVVKLRQEVPRRSDLAAGVDVMEGAGGVALIVLLDTIANIDQCHNKERDMALCGDYFSGMTMQVGPMESSSVTR
jgi:hypothetical protein